MSKNEMGLPKTDTPEYAKELFQKQTANWKHLLDVQAPYRWNIRRLSPGFVLDIGCGFGRNLFHLNGNGIGIDHNLDMVKNAKEKGLQVFTPEEFATSEINVAGRFDTLLLAHVIEHMTEEQAIELIRIYLPNLKSGGKLILITPQEAGYRSDATHVQFMDFSKSRNIIRALGLGTGREFSFPFPRFAGHFFLYNEFISIGYKQS